MLHRLLSTARIHVLEIVQGRASFRETPRNHICVGHARVQHTARVGGCGGHALLARSVIETVQVGPAGAGARQGNHPRDADRLLPTARIQVLEIVQGQAPVHETSRNHAYRTRVVCWTRATCQTCPRSGASWEGRLLVFGHGGGSIPKLF